MSITIEITWKNIMGLAMTCVGVKSLFIAFTTGNLDTGWLLSANIKKSKTEFVIKTAIAIAYTAIVGCLMIGMGNDDTDFNLLSLFFK